MTTTIQGSQQQGYNPIALGAIGALIGAGVLAALGAGYALLSLGKKEQA